MHLSKVVANPLMDILLHMCGIGGSYQQQARRSSNEQQSLYLSVNTIYSILSLEVLVIVQLLSTAFSSACLLWVYHISNKQQYPCR